MRRFVIGWMSHATMFTKVRTCARSSARSGAGSNGCTPGNASSRYSNAAIDWPIKNDVSVSSRVRTGTDAEGLMAA